MFVGLDIGLPFVAVSFIVASLITVLCLSQSINNTKKMTSTTQTTNSSNTDAQANVEHDQAVEQLPSGTDTSPNSQVGKSCSHIGWKRRSPEGAQGDLNDSPSKKQSPFPNKEKVILLGIVEFGARRLLAM